MIIDGYTPPSTEVAFDQGVSFEYPTPYGTVTIRSKLAGRDNVKYRLAMKTYNEWVDRRRNLDSTDDKEAERRFVGILHDHVVIDWSTTITSSGEAIEPNRDNFVALMTAPATSNVFGVFLRDASDEKHFRALGEEEALGKPEPAFAG